MQIDSIDSILHSIRSIYDDPALLDSPEADNASIKKKTAMKAKRQGDAATAKGDKEVTETSKAKDEDVLSDTNAECKQTSDEYEKNQVLCGIFREFTLSQNACSF